MAAEEYDRDSSYVRSRTRGSAAERVPLTGTRRQGRDQLAGGSSRDPVQTAVLCCFPLSHASSTRGIARCLNTHLRDNGTRTTVGTNHLPRSQTARALFQDLIVPIRYPSFSGRSSPCLFSSSSFRTGGNATGRQAKASQGGGDQEGPAHRRT